MYQHVVAFEGAIRTRDGALEMITPVIRDVACRKLSILEERFINLHREKQDGMSASKCDGHGVVNYMSAFKHDQRRFPDTGPKSRVRQKPPGPDV